MIVFIPIKEISQRVPGKNFRDLNGESLYKRCLLKLSDYNIFVDTDSDKILSSINEDKRLNHVTPYMRDKDLTGHEISVCSLIERFISKYDFKNKQICQIHVTSPFLKLETLEIAKSYMNNYDSVVSCNTYQNRLWRKEDYGYCPVNHNPLKLEQTQDLPIFYEENSLFYIFNSSNFLKTNCRIGKNPYFYECNYPENIDIDTEDDWGLVESFINSSDLIKCH
jgi:N-acylneuraminate cytidylyltransferase